MIVSSHPGVDKTLAMLDRLKGVVRDFAAHEEELKREHSIEMAKLRQRCEQALREHEALVETETARADSDFETAKQQCESRHGQRQSRINQAYKTVKQRRLEAIESEDGRHKFEIQRDLLQTDRDRETQLKETDAAFASFTNELATEYGTLNSSETRARRCLRGYRKFLRLLARPSEAPAPDPAMPHDQLLGALRARLGDVENQLRRFRAYPLPLLFRFLPLWVLILLIVLVAVALIPVLGRFGITSITQREAEIAATVGLAVLVALHFFGGRHAKAAATAIAAALGQACRLYDLCAEKSLAWHQQETERIKHDASHRTEMLQEQWRRNLKDGAERRAEWSIKVDLRAKRALDKNNAQRQAQLAQLEQAHAARRAQAQRVATARRRELEKAREETEREVSVRSHARWQTLVTDWNAAVQPLYETLNLAKATADKFFPEWHPLAWQSWTPPVVFAHAAKFATLEVDFSRLTAPLPHDERLRLPGTPHLTLPLLLAVPEQGSVLFETKNAGRDAVIGSLNNIILRFLSVAPPGRVNFTIIDPVELGQNFAGIMHLADFEDRLINSRIWTQTSQIEEQLARLNEHIEKVTQMYLRNEYETIAEYNQQAGRIAEKYHFLVVADFPVNFSELATKRLLSIAASGARCGVYTLIHWDQRRPVPMEFVPEELRKNSVCIQPKGDTFALAGRSLEGTTLRLDPPPDPELATEFLQRVGQCSVDSNRVEMPFAEAAPPPSEQWRDDTTTELRVPIGRTGATKLQHLSLGKGTRQHALIAGKTGSGKSNLFHVIITNLSLWCSPEQVEFYLVDFKKGVEFKCYATHRLPHARVVAIESDREFGLSVLQRVDEELKRRGELFRKLEVQDIAGYKRAGGKEALPRTLLLIDEFQEFFVEDDRISQSAALLLDRIVRQGRAFGIHVLLGSQTLGGAYTLARATLGQMVVRIALQCNEADAYLIMDEGNPAPRLLSRPGEAIYNDAAGSIEGNSPFQIVWLPDDVRETYLEEVNQLATEDSKPHPPPIVFEGNAPAHVEENVVLRRLLEEDSLKPTPAPRVWLGAPNSIKGPTEAAFHRQSGNNLLIVGQREEAVRAMLIVSLVALAAQHPRGTARFILFDAHRADSPQRQLQERLIKVIPHEIRLATNADIDEIMTGLTEDMAKCSEAEDGSAAPAAYVFIRDLQKFKKLRYEEDFGFSSEDAKTAAPPGTQLNKLICEGPRLGFHVIATCDTVNNANRFLSRKALSEFEMRVLFQMSANDSATLIDSPKANDLGLHRAIFYNEQEGYLETFRPYALPGSEWVDRAARNLARLLG